MTEYVVVVMVCAMIMVGAGREPGVAAAIPDAFRKLDVRFARMLATLDEAP
jgi:hypothetical protein